MQPDVLVGEWREAAVRAESAMRAHPGMVGGDGVFDSDLMRAAGFVSAAHTSDIIEETIHAFERSITRLQQEGILS